ncbi:MAG: DUF983 domain-containing protein [Calditrichae bacterium]|nr:DUF983 domain-containing protein [Calditrichota bacterium]MCB9058458.1 DUF983 domain-containing protein [Calditrichia bacterium]
MNAGAMLGQKCPKCNNGKMFYGVFKMHTECPVCGFKFERQEGYFTSAIFIGNFLYALIVAPTLMIMTAVDASVWKIAAVLGSFSLIAIPVIFRFARTIWLHVDFMIHPDEALPANRIKNPQNG